MLFVLPYSSHAQSLVKEIRILVFGVDRQAYSIVAVELENVKGMSEQGAAQTLALPAWVDTELAHPALFRIFKA